ncbi:hypothetical protein [Streptomyces sp. 7N604]|uniref:hypothetical protein n=1 Tax=Streptomyces sp. 7N604 TaxID=3457415 RepID=UPI003FD12A3D
MGWEVGGAGEEATGLVHGMLAAALGTADARAWTALDIGVRDLAGYGRYGRFKPPSDTELAVALCHPDGRIREAALRWAADAPDLLPLVVIRCSDWAAPVRDRARALLRDLLPAAEPQAMPLLAAVVLRVARRSRGGFARELLEETLRSGPYETLKILLGSGDRSVRRLAYRIAVGQRLLSPARLARTAATDTDVVVQDLCAEAALAGAADGACDEVLGLLLGGRQPRVRSAGVTALRRAGRAAEAELFLADRSALVRACARWVLRQHGTDPVPLYRALCADPGAVELRPGAAAGLAECGTRADAGLLWPLLAHSRPAVRARAAAGLAALCTLDAAGAGRLRPLLEDTAPAVAREAAAALVPSARLVPEEWLGERLSTDRPRHVRAAAFRVLCAHGGAAGLRAAVRMSADEDPRLRARARTAASRWAPGPTSTIPAGERAELVALIDHHEPDVGAGTAALLRWLLRIGR